ncbi:MAG: hypothetical protein WBV62_14085 [Roseobacter sp.]
MFANARSFFWATEPREVTAPEPPKKRPTPVFIGDAVQPWGGETLLLSILRDDALRKDAED